MFWRSFKSESNIAIWFSLLLTDNLCVYQEKMVPHSRPQPRSVSQLNLQSGHDQQQKNTDNASVVSFSSVAASHQNLDTKVDMVSSLLSMLGTHDKDDVARTLLAMSSSTDSCSAMRQSGCLPLLIKLLHDPEYEVKGINWEARQRAGEANFCAKFFVSYELYYFVVGDSS